jgi:hypothetical protein
MARSIILYDTRIISLSKYLNSFLWGSKLELTTTQDIYQFLKMFVPSNALNTALELGIFWQLSEQSRNATEIAQINNIPDHRCQALLDLLFKLGLLDKHEDKYSVSSLAQHTILNAYSAESWAFLAKQAQDHYPLLTNLTTNISYPNSLWEKQNNVPPDWFSQMKQSRVYAKKFTYGLYEYHLSFAKKFAQNFEMSGVNSMMDIGGGSGVMSLELLKHHSHLSATVIDIENVCIYGRKIAEKYSMSNRISYLTLDFLREDLPKGFDLILQCDAGIFTVDFFSKLRTSLSANGRLIIITNIDDDSAWLTHPESQVSLFKTMNRFLHSLEIAGKRKVGSTIETVKLSLLEAEFREVTHELWDKGEVIIQALK